MTTCPNDHQNFLATTEHRRPGRILYYASFTPDLRRRVIERIGTDNVDAHFGFARAAGINLKRPADLPPLDTLRYYAPGELPEGTTFNPHGVARIPSGYYHFFGYLSPLRNARSLKELEDYPLDDMSDWPCTMTPADVAAAHADGRFVTGGAGHIFECAWQIRGMEQFIRDTLEQPAWAECLIERLAAQAQARAVAFARAGADRIQCGDDVATQHSLMISPDQWRSLLHEPWRRIWRQIKKISPQTRIWYHSDGAIMKIIPDLIDAGLDILNPVQPECLDVAEVHRRFGRRLTLDGCIGTQSLMPFGTPDDVRTRVRELIENYGREGGLILSPTHILEPEVPIENIEAFADACREFGTFE